MQMICFAIIAESRDITELLVCTKTHPVSLTTPFFEGQAVSSQHAHTPVNLQDSKKVMTTNILKL